MAIQSISTPSVILNNDAMAIMGDFVYKNGFAEKNIRVANNGNNTTMIISKDLSTAKGYCKFSVPSTVANVAKLRDVQQKIGTNVVKVTDPDSNFTITFTSMTMLKDPEVTLGKDGAIEFEFEGNQGI